MLFSNSGFAWSRTLTIQLAIIAALTAFLALYLPAMARRKTAADATAREQRIRSFAQSILIQDPSRVVSATGPDDEVLSHPQRLSRPESLSEVQQALGAPTAEGADVRGGQHLTWTGTRHRLEAAFNKGQLYNVTYSTLTTGHGVSVFESSEYFQAF